MIRSLFIALLLLFNGAAISAESREEKIIVNLAQQSHRVPIYLAKVAEAESSFDAGYCEKLRAILLSDIHLNGVAQVVAVTHERETLAVSSTWSSAVTLEKWRRQRIPYVIAMEIKGKRAVFNLLCVDAKAIKRVKSEELSGDLAIDRREIHELADQLHKSIFGKVGIAATRLLYARSSRPKPDMPWQSEIWESDVDGANERRVSAEGCGYCLMPVYLPPTPGNRSNAFLYIAYRGGQPKIYLGSLKSPIAQRIIPLSGNQLMPTISQSGDMIAFISDITGNPDLFLMPFSREEGAKEKPRQIFTAYRAVQGTPTFNPKGTKIAFVSNRDGMPRIYVIDIPPPFYKLERIKPQLISKASGESSAPSWSPDGSKIAFCGRFERVRQIWVHDFESGDTWPLTDGAGDKENPTWAPDSRHLAYNTTGAVGSELYIIDIDNLEPIKISSGCGEKRFPCWEPRMGK